MNTRIQPTNPSGAAQLSAADALSFLSSDREAVARRFLTPLWYDALSCLGLGVLAFLCWAMGSGAVAVEGGQYLWWNAAVVTVLIALLIAMMVLVDRLERRGIHWMTVPPTPVAWTWTIVAVLPTIAAIILPVALAFPWWEALIAAVVAAAATLFCARMVNREVRRYIMAGGSMVRFQIGSGGRRYDKNGDELWTMARFHALPDDERRREAGRVVSPWWVYPAVALSIMAAIGFVVATAVFILGRSVPFGGLIPLALLTVAVASWNAANRWRRASGLDPHMMPANTRCWAVFILMIATYLIPVYLTGYTTGAWFRHPGVAPTMRLAAGGLVYIVLFSALGWIFDRVQRDAIAKGE